MNSTPNESSTDAGAAYVFTGLGIDPRLGIMADGSGGCLIRCEAHAGLAYHLERASNVKSSTPWPTLLTTNAPPSGLLEFHDTTPLPGQAFHRVGQP